MYVVKKWWIEFYVKLTSYDFSVYNFDFGHVVNLLSESDSPLLFAGCNFLGLKFELNKC